MDICLATTIADRKGELIDKARLTWDAMAARFFGIVVHATDTTHPDWFEFLDVRGVPYVTSPPDWMRIGLHRRRALQRALDVAAERYFYADLDHVMRWVERMPSDLDAALAQAASCECLVVGRGEISFAAAPRRLRETEVVTNHIFALTTGHAWDLMMAARCFSPAAARLVVAESQEETVGNDVAWPMQCELAGFSMGYVASDGLTYETNSVYAEDSRDAEDAEPAAWIQRVDYLKQQVDAMKPFVDRYRMRGGPAT